MTLILDSFFYWMFSLTKPAHEKSLLYDHVFCIIQTSIQSHFVVLFLKKMIQNLQEMGIRSFRDIKMCTVWLSDYDWSGKQPLWQFNYVQCNWAGSDLPYYSHVIIRVKRGQRATVCYSMSSGRTGCGSGMMDFFSVSLDRAFLMSAIRKDQIGNCQFFKPKGLCLFWGNSALLWWQIFQMCRTEAFFVSFNTNHLQLVC